MLLLKATERNWGPVGPGDWEKRTWKIQEDGTYVLKTAYRPDDSDDPEIPEQREEGELSPEQMEILRVCIEAYWTDDAADGCDGSAWEFKLYENDAVVRHRELGYIEGLEPYESIAALLGGEEE